MSVFFSYLFPKHPFLFFNPLQTIISYCF